MDNQGKSEIYLCFNFRCHPRGRKNLKVSSTGRVEVVEPDINQEEEVSAKPKKKKTRAKKKVVVDVDSGSDEPSDEADFKECESRFIQFRDLYSNIFILVEIDYHLGCKVFGYRDLKTGRFQQRSNYSFKIDAFCDGIRNEYI